MGNTDYRRTDERGTGIPADVMGLLKDSRSGGNGALCSMAEDLFFFAELIDMLRCIIRMMRIMGDRVPEEVPDMAAGVSDLEIPVLEKWELFMELI